jgi:hypothetical protein
MLTLVLVATIAVLSALDPRVRSGRRPLHFAMAPVRFRIGGAAPRRVDIASLVAMARTDPAHRPPSRPFRNPFANADALAKRRPVTGINAHIRWYQRARSLIGIVVLVGLMGVLVAVSIGVAFFAARIVLELLVG